MDLKVEKEKLETMSFEIKMLDQELDGAIKDNDKSKVYEITDNIKKLKDIAYEQKRKIVLHIQKNCDHKFIYLASNRHGKDSVHDASGTCITCGKHLESGYQIEFKDFMSRALHDNYKTPTYTYASAVMAHEKLSHSIGIKNITVKLLDEKAEKEQAKTDNKEQIKKLENTNQSKSL